jgi:predicted pyridoxine 5'-phosphate oxidase superfamily flavin-nucleotide-binding protein
MVHLTLAGLSEDGKRLLLTSDAGVEFTLDADDRLRAALRGDHARLGQLEIKMDSVLRPRDIQARIRAGETLEAVAEAAQTSVDKIMPVAAPVLAEREHVAQRAQRASLRRSAATAGASSAAAGQGRTLGDAIASHLRGRNVDPGGVDWDAWRREDGRWTLTAEFQAEGQQVQGVFTFDPPGNYVAIEDDDARWLVGEGAAATTSEAASADDLATARRRRLSAVPADELPLGEDAIGLVSDQRAEAPSLGAEASVEAHLDETDQGTRSSEPDEVVDEEPDLRDDEPAPRAPRRKGRASVPSWDEIMFGGGKHD